MKPATKVPRARNKLNSAKPEKRASALRRRLDHQIEFMPPDALTPYERNPTLHPAEQIDEIINSIKEFGFTVPILVDENNMILAGHGRQLAALEMKLPRVPVIKRAGLSEEQKRAYVLADNKIARNAELDWALVAGELQALKEAGFDLELTGFKDFEYELLLEADWKPPAIHDREIGTDLFTIGLTLEQKKIVDAAVMAMQNIKGIELTMAEGVTEVCAEFMKHD